MCHHVCIPLAQMSRGIQYRFGEWITHFEGSKIAEVSLQISYCELWELELQNVQITQKSCRHLLAIRPSQAEQQTVQIQALTTCSGRSDSTTVITRARPASTRETRRCVSSKLSSWLKGSMENEDLLGLAWRRRRPRLRPLK